MAPRVDLDELARLEDERDFLLSSIEDLDREHEAGDVDEDDYRELRDGYVARAAEAIRAIEAHETALAPEPVAPGRRRRAFLAVAGVLAFTVLAGVLLANQVGSRGSGQITGAGAVPEDPATKCRTLSFGEPAKAVACYDEILANAPDDVDALTYQGWAKVRAGDVAGGSALFDRVVELDPTYADVHVFRASVAKNAGDFAAAQRELDRLYDLNPSPLVISTMQQMGLDSAVAEGLLPADVKACWDQAKDALGKLDKATAEEDQLAAFASLTVVDGCLNDALSTHPDDADAWIFRSLVRGVLRVIKPTSIDNALSDVDHALQVRPDDPTALLLRSVWRDQTGDLDGAQADLDSLGDRRTSPLIAPFVSREDVRSDIAAQRSNGTDRPTTTARGK